VVEALFYNLQVQQDLICKLIAWQFSNLKNYADEILELSLPRNYAMCSAHPG
jgi:hypothetical protein